MQPHQSLEYFLFLMTIEDLLGGIYEILIDTPMNAFEKFEDRSRDERICLGPSERLLTLLDHPIRNPIPRTKKPTGQALEA